MADVFKNFTGAVGTANTVIFTVPEADVANNIPVTTYVAKTLYVVHSLANAAKTAITIYHYDKSRDATIGFAGETTVKEAINFLQNGIYVFEAGDQLIIQANLDGEANFSCSLLEIKQQQ